MTKKLEYVDVRDMAEALTKLGVTPTTRLVVAQLGGSNTTAMRFLEKWELERDAASGAVEVPEALTEAIRGELGSAITKARAAASDKVVELRQMLDDAMCGKEVAEREREELQERCTSLRTERDRMVGQCSEQALQIDAQRDVEQSLRGELAAARDEAAFLRQACEVANSARVTFQDHELAMRSELLAAATAAKELRAERSDAERERASSQAKLATERAAHAQTSALAEVQGTELRALRAEVVRLSAVEGAVQESRATVSWMCALLSGVIGQPAAVESTGSTPAQTTAADQPPQTGGVAHGQDHAAPAR